MKCLKLEIIELIKQCVVIGCGSHANSVISIIESSIDSFKIIGLVDVADNYDPAEEKSGYKVILTLNELLSSSSKYLNLYCVLAIGDNLKRETVFEQLLSKNFKLPNIISGNAFIDRTVTMGIANVIGHGSFINAQAELGSNNLINTKAVIEHDCCIDSHTHIAPNGLVCGEVSVADLTFIGAGAVVLPKVSTQKGSVVGAGAVLTTNVVERNAIFAGVPAKAI